MTARCRLLLSVSLVSAIPLVALPEDVGATTAPGGSPAPLSGGAAPAGARAPDSLPSEPSAPAVPGGTTPRAEVPAIGSPATPAKDASLDVSRILKVDGQLRFRYEYLKPYNYTTSGVDQDDDYVLMRTRLGLTFTPHRKVSARVQLQDSRIWGEEGNLATSPSGAVNVSLDKVDLHQGYVDLVDLFDAWLGPQALSFRIGRQEMAFGDQRFVSALDWSNIGRSWDAARMTLRPPGVPGDLRIDIFASIIKETASNDATGLPVPGEVSTIDAKQDFHGLYATFENIQPLGDLRWTDPSGEDVPFFGRHQLDGYIFYRDLQGDFVGEDGDTGNVREVTGGGRCAGGLLRDSLGGGLDYSAELAYQFGDYANDDIDAFGYSLTAGYTLAARALRGTKVRVGVEYDYGSGDSDPDDGKRGTFDPLYPFAHKYQGYQDLFTWKNGRDLALKADVTFPKDWRVLALEFAYHFFWLTRSEDAWYNAALAQVRRDPTGAPRKYLGQEVDLTMRYAIVPSAAVLYFGYSRFFAGDYVKDTGEAPDRDFVFAQLTVDF